MTALSAHPRASQDAPHDQRPTRDVPTCCFDLRLYRPTSKSVVVQVSGDLDARTAGTLHEMLAARLSSMAETVVLDLSRLNFISVTGLELLLHAHHRAASRGVQLCLVDGPRCLERALIAAQMTDVLPLYDTLEQALAQVGGRRRNLAAVV